MSLMHSATQSVARVALAAALAALVAATAGCANVPGGVPAAAAGASRPAPTLEIGYDDSSVRAEIEQAGLATPLVHYWSVLAARDWNTLYALEHADRLPTAEFYSAYHARAWPVVSVEVVRAEVESEIATLTLRTSFRNPGKAGRVESGYRRDVWVRQAGGGWQHKVTDPMLIGLH